MNCTHCRTPLTNIYVEIEIVSRITSATLQTAIADEVVHATVQVCHACAGTATDTASQALTGA